MATRDRPNILFFFTDDQRFDTIQALGCTDIATPNLDGLVARGTSFRNAYIMGGTCGAVCMPSRAMLMTGRTLFHLDDRGQTIPEDHVMLPEALRQDGYSTFGTGKWHNSPAAYARCFTDGGMVFFGGMDDHWNVAACDFDPDGEYPQEARRRRKGTHSSELFSDEAVRFLSEHQGDAPFFMYVAYMAPHDPRTMPRKYLDMYDPAEIPLPENFLPEHPFDNGELAVRDEKLAAFPREPDEIRQHLAEYYAMITHADAEMGRVLDALRESGHSEDTIVVFAGDNGLALGRHGLMGKQNMYEHSVHVPLVMSGPGIPEGEERPARCYLLDIYPTLCEMSGTPIPDSVEGKSLVPVLEDPALVGRETLLFAYRDLQRSVSDGRHKLIEYVVDGVRTTQLFDLQADPLEMHDLAGDRARSGQVEEFRGKLRVWRDELDDWGDAFWEGFEG